MNAVTQFSGQKAYHEAVYQLYNVFFTFLPVMVYGLLDKDVTREISLQRPELYTYGPKKYYFNPTLCAQWILNSYWHGAVVFGVPFFVLADGQIANDGRPYDMWHIGSLIFLLVILVVNLKILVECSFLTWIMWLNLG